MKWGDYVDKKTERVQLLLSKEEIETVKKMAKEMGLTVSAYFRLKALCKI